MKAPFPTSLAMVTKTSPVNVSINPPLQPPNLGVAERDTQILNYFII
jgi:hypothetical protein